VTLLAIPYVQIPPIRLFGAVPIQPFGVLVGLALVVGYLLGRRRARLTGLDPQLATDGMIWAVVGGFVMGHLLDVILYYPELIRESPLVLLTIWSDISSMGGFLGGALGLYLFCNRLGLPVRPYADMVVFGLVPAWIFRRMGCGLAHDHPGVPTHFFLGVRFPDGVVRHDLGFEEMLLAVLLTVVLYALRRVRPFEGFHTALMLLLYAPVRFLLDFLRAADRRYLGLTPAQYFCVLMVVTGIYLVVTSFQRRSSQATMGNGPPRSPVPETATRRPGEP
jgi:phosphatidylglycerol---prolipoprotein diacylglyceryl transferase